MNCANDEFGVNSAQNHPTPPSNSDGAPILSPPSNSSQRQYNIVPPFCRGPEWQMLQLSLNSSPPPANERGHAAMTAPCLRLSRLPSLPRDGINNTMQMTVRPWRGWQTAPPPPFPATAAATTWANRQCPPTRPGQCPPPPDREGGLEPSPPLLASAPFVSSKDGPRMQAPTRANWHCHCTAVVQTGGDRT
jgi:hypothetical protein